jgi:hypothetical protein
MLSLMERDSNTIESIFEKTGDYLETKIDLLKLKAVSKSSDITSSFVSRLVIICVFAFVFFILNIGIALWLGNLTGKLYYGFFILAGFYLIVGILLYLFRNRWLKEPVGNMIIKKLLN